jgi:hypothetical protein
MNYPPSPLNNITTETQAIPHARLSEDHSLSS